MYHAVHHELEADPDRVRARSADRADLPPVAAEAVAKGEFDDEDTPTIDIGIEEQNEQTAEILEDGRTVDPETGELFSE